MSPWQSRLASRSRKVCATRRSAVPRLVRPARWRCARRARATLVHCRVQGEDGHRRATVTPACGKPLQILGHVQTAVTSGKKNRMVRVTKDAGAGQQLLLGQLSQGFLADE